MRPRQNGRYFVDDIFQCIFLNENIGIFIPKVPMDNISALVQIKTTIVVSGSDNGLAPKGAKPLSEPVVAKFTDANMRHRPQ